MTDESDEPVADDPESKNRYSEEEIAIVEGQLDRLAERGVEFEPPPLLSGALEDRPDPPPRGVRLFFAEDVVAEDGGTGVVFGWEARSQAWIELRPARETPVFGLRVPGDVDPADVVTDIGNLADDVEAKLETLLPQPLPSPPIGPAGGALAGSYPNPTLANPTTLNSLGIACGQVAVTFNGAASTPSVSVSTGLPGTPRSVCLTAAWGGALSYFVAGLVTDVQPGRFVCQGFTTNGANGTGIAYLFWIAIH